MRLNESVLLPLKKIRKRKKTQFKLRSFLQKKINGKITERINSDACSVN